MSLEKLGQSDFDDLSAYCDGELPPPRAAEIRRLIETDPLWRAEHDRLAALDRALDSYNVPPAGAQLADRIIAKAHQVRRVSPIMRLVRYAAPLAAAAAVLLAVKLYWPQPTRPDAGTVAVAPADPLASVPAKDRFVVENLDFFKNYDAATNLETLQAIEKAQDGSGS